MKILNLLSIVSLSVWVTTSCGSFDFNPFTGTNLKKKDYSVMTTDESIEFYAKPGCDMGKSSDC